jgi:hypothetical protein
MNSSALLLAQLEPPWYTVIFQFFLLPLLIGNIIDISFNKLVGSQNCSFNGTDKICSIFGQTMPSLFREGGRSIIQMLVLFFTLKYFSNYFKSTVYPVAGVTIFILSQPELFEDFRRFVNSLLFIIKHN